MKSPTRALSPALALLVLVVCAVSFWACDGSGTFNPKLAPETRLSNIPPDSILAPNPRIALSWIGDDADGYVVAYKYRWNFRLTAADTFQYKKWTTLLNLPVSNLALIILPDEGVAPEAVAPKVYKYFSTLPRTGLDFDTKERFFHGDTVLIEGVRVYASNPDGERYPTHTNPSSGIFIFDSPDHLNPHTFEIAAVDNDGLVDPTPATLYFTTPQAGAPSTEILVAPRDTVFALDYTTDTFTGITFAYQGIDKNSRTLEYQWVVDKDIWLERTGRIPWSEFSSATSVQVTAADFPDKYAVDHVFTVRARNEFGAIDTLGVFMRQGQPVYNFRAFYTIYPEFKRPGFTPRTLLINNSYDFDTLAVDPTRPNYAMLENYYRDLYTGLGKVEGVDYDIWRVKQPGGATIFPGAGVLSHYNKVHFIGDVVNFDNFKWSKTAGTELSLSVARQAFLQAYCEVGGKLLINGWNTTRPDQIVSSGITQFMMKILHISSSIPGGFFSPTPDYVGAYAEPGRGYPDLPLDAAKLDTMFHGALPYQWVYQLYGFGEILYRYNSQNPLNPRGSTQGFPVAVRYLGITYDVFFVSLPLYYSDKAASIELLRKINQEFDSPR
jgi:hypothetical protein